MLPLLTLKGAYKYALADNIDKITKNKFCVNKSTNSQTNAEGLKLLDLKRIPLGSNYSISMKS